MRYSLLFICAASCWSLVIERNLEAQPAVQPAPAIVIPPMPRPNVGYFRQLLAMSATERIAALADKPEEKRKVLIEKLREYELLPDDERERRLQLVELWGLLVPLMKLPPSERGPVLATIPKEDRTLVEERLQQWDLLPPEVQNEVIENKLTIYYFVRLESSTPSERDSILQKMPEGSRRTLEAKLEEWRALPSERRQVMYQQFSQFFELPPTEKERTLEALPEAERLKMAKSLEQFAGLPPEQRQMCIDSFRKLANMSAEERALFLRNAERWQAMTPRERETWRNLVSLLPQPKPPMPGEGATVQPPPPGSHPKPPPEVRMPGLSK